MSLPNTTRGLPLPLEGVLLTFRVNSDSIAGATRLLDGIGQDAPNYMVVLAFDHDQIGARETLDFIRKVAADIPPFTSSLHHTIWTRPSYVGT